MSVGSKIKQLRHKSGESLQDVANAVGASKAHVWEIEKEKSRNPSLDLLTRLADHFQVSVSYLTGEVPDKNNDNEELLVMYRAIKSLPKDKREVLQGIIESMKKKPRR